MPNIYEERFIEVINVQLLAPGHAVFQATVRASGGRQGVVVIKLETALFDFHQAKATHAWAIMGRLSKAGGQAAIMSVQEVAIFVDKVRQTLPIEDDDRQAVEAGGGQGNLFVKMKMIQGVVSIDSATRAFANNDKTESRRLASVLTSKCGLENLGRVVAGDAFLWNSDRFKPHAGHLTKTYNGVQFGPLRAVANVGNILFGVQGGETTAIGIDAIDPTRIGEFYDGWDEQQWFGWLLHPDCPHTRQYLTDIIHDLNVLLGPSRRFGVVNVNRLPSNAYSRLKDGFLWSRHAIAWRRHQWIAQFGADRNLNIERRIQIALGEVPYAGIGPTARFV